MNNFDAEITYDSVDNKGYTFVPHSEMSEKAKEIIWLSALPNGTNWNNKRYEGISIIKTFKVEHLFAVSSVNVTSHQDEIGRKGILNAKIKLLTPVKYTNWLKEQYETTQDISIVRDFELLVNSIFERAKNFSIADQKLVIYRPFKNQRDVDINLALLIGLCSELSLEKRLVNLYNKKTFTSLALSPDDISPIMCIPIDETAKKRPEYINLTQKIF